VIGRYTVAPLSKDVKQIGHIGGGGGGISDDTIDE
jgi:hypothetical protein